MLKDDQARWKAVMLFSAILTEDQALIADAMKPVDALGIRQAVADALRVAADAIEMPKEGAKLETDLRRRTLALVAAVSDQDEAATDKVLATFDPDGDDGDEVREVLGLAQHVLDVRMGYATGCADEDTPDDPPVAFPTDFM